MYRNLYGKSSDLSYKLSRRKMKGIKIKVEKDGTIAISAGKIVPNKDIDNFVLLSEDKIIKVREKLKKTIYYINENCQFNEGDIFYIWGEKHIINRSNSQNKTPEIKSEDKIIAISLKSQNPQKDMETFLRNQCKIVFEKLSQKVYNTLQEYKGEEPALVIKKMKSCWGICYYTKNKIILNTRLAYFPKTLAEETMYHEYIHFIYHNHSKEFYSLLNKYTANRKTEN